MRGKKSRVEGAGGEIRGGEKSRLGLGNGPSGTDKDGNRQGANRTKTERQMRFPLLKRESLGEKVRESEGENIDARAGACHRSI